MNRDPILLIGFALLFTGLEEELQVLSSAKDHVIVRLHLLMLVEKSHLASWSLLRVLLLLQFALVERKQVEELSTGFDLACLCPFKAEHANGLDNNDSVISAVEVAFFIEFSVENRGIAES